MRIMGLPQNFYRLGFIRQSCLPRRENALYILAMAGYVHKLRFVELTTLSSGLVKSTCFARRTGYLGSRDASPNTKRDKMARTQTWRNICGGKGK